MLLRAQAQVPVGPEFERQAEPDVERQAGADAEPLAPTADVQGQVTLGAAVHHYGDWPLPVATAPVCQAVSQNSRKQGQPVEGVTFVVNGLGPHQRVSAMGLDEGQALAHQAVGAALKALLLDWDPADGCGLEGSVMSGVQQQGPYHEGETRGSLCALQRFRLPVVDISGVPRHPHRERHDDGQGRAATNCARREDDRHV